MAVKKKASSSLKDQLENGINHFSSILDPEGCCKCFENVDIAIEQGDFEAGDNLGDNNNDRELQEATQEVAIGPQKLDEDVIKGIGNDIIAVEECFMEKMMLQQDHSSEQEVSFYHHNYPSQQLTMSRQRYLYDHSSTEWLYCS